MTAYIWVGGASGDWNDANSWSPQGVPGAGDSVDLGTAANITVEGETVASVFAGGTTALTGDITVTGTMTNGAIVAGTVSIGTADGVTIDGGTVDIGTANSTTIDDGTVKIGTASGGLIAGGTVSIGTANSVMIDGGIISADIITGPGWSVISGGQVTVTNLDSAMIEGGTVTASSIDTSAVVSSAVLIADAFTSTAAMWVEAGGTATISGNTTVTRPTAGQGILGTLSGGQLAVDGGLMVSSGGFVDVDGTTTVSGSVTVDNSNLYVAFHGSGGEFDAPTLTLRNGVFEFWNSGGYAAIGGGTTGHADNQVQIGASGSLVGYGTVKGPNLFIDDRGDIEAQGGKLIVDANIATNGDPTVGDVVIDANSTLELGGAFGAGDTVTFNTNGTGALILDDLPEFGTPSFPTAPAVITQIAPGDKIVLPSTSGGKIVAATIGMLNGVQTLEIRENRKHIDNPKSAGTRIYDIQIHGGAPDGGLKGEYFQVTQTSNGVQNTKGNDTTLTLAQGNPIALSINAPAARQASGVNGSGVKIGIISDSFNRLGGMSNDTQSGALTQNVNILPGFDGPLRTDEGRAMAQIVDDIAPGVSIDFATGFGGLSVMAAAIRALQADGCQIIVDDVSYQPWVETLFGGAINKAIDAAYKAGVTYVTAAGNDRIPAPGTPIFGHRLDRFALTVAAMNMLSTPSSVSSVGGYIQVPQTEPFSSIGTTGSKPEITGPDGGPTTFPLYPGSGLDPFFGTSAAAPAVAAVAALMMAKDFQLRYDPAEVRSLLTSNALDFGEPASQEGAGLVQADKSLAATPTVADFYRRSTVSTSSAITASSSAAVASAALSQPAGDIDSGATLQLQVTMTGAVIVSGGTPDFTLSDGGAAIYDYAASDPGNGVLMFDHTVGATDQTASLAVSGINLNGATIDDGTGNTPDFSPLFDIATGLSVNSPLVVTSVAATAANGELQIGQTTQLNLSLNEAVTVGTGGGLPTLTLNNAGTASYDAALSDPAGGTLVFDYTLAAGDDSVPDLSVYAVNLPSGTTVRDAAGNNVDFAAALTVGTGLQAGPAFVNGFSTSPTGAAKTTQSVQLTLSMSEAVAVDTSAALPSLTLNNGGTANYDAGSSNPSGGTLVFDYTVASQDQTPALAITQVNLNGGSVADDHGIAADFGSALNFPAELSINSPFLATQAASSRTGMLPPGQTIQITLTTNETVQIDRLDNFGADPTLTLNDGGTATYDAAASIAASNAVVFDYTFEAGDHTTGLAITAVSLPGPVFTDSQGYLPDFSAVLNAALGVRVGDAVNDFDGDGASDVLLHNTGSGSYADWGMSGSTIATADNLTFNGNPIALDPSWSVGGVADFNGDGKADILLRNPDTSGFVVFTMHGATITAAGNLTFNGATVGLDPSWAVVGTADFNGDGKADILLRNPDTSGFVDFTMNGSAITAADNLTFNGATVGLDPSWAVVGTGDFNGDGKADILLRNTNGATTDFTMTGATVTAADSLTFQGNPVFLDSTWKTI